MNPPHLIPIWQTLPALSGWPLSEPYSQQITAILAAFTLCSLLGLERHFHQKNAGVKTHVLVGVGSCLFTLVSAHGFAPILTDTIHTDPARIAAQIVSGIGFLGAGVIFVNNDAVRGLTTAATIWLSAAIGMACGASMIPIAVFTLLIHYLAIFAIGPLASRIPASHHNQRTIIEYATGHGVMRQIIVTASQMGYRASVNSTSKMTFEGTEGVRVIMHFEGRHPQNNLLRALGNIDGVWAVDTVHRNDLD